MFNLWAVFTAALLILNIMFEVGLGLLAGANQMVNTANIGWSLYKDLNNIDNRRNLLLNQELMKQQFEHQADLNKEAYEYNRLLQSQANEFNQENMERQYNYNRYLSSLGRNIYASRMSGINPAGGVSSGSGSVNLPQSSTPSSSPGVASMSNYSHTAPVAQIQDVLSPAMDKIADIRLKNSQSKLNDLTSITQMEKQLTEIERMKSEATRNYKEAGLSDIEIKLKTKSFDLLIDKLTEEINQLRSQADANSRNAASNEKQAEAAATQADAAKEQAAASTRNAATNEVNAQTNKEQLKENIRHNKASEAIQSKYNEIYGVQVQANKGYLSSLRKEIDYKCNLIAEQQQYYKANKDLLNKENEFFERKVMSLIAVNEAQEKKLLAEANEAAERAGLVGKEKDWYVFNNLFSKYMQLTDANLDVINTVMSVIPTFSAPKVARHQALKTMGVDQRGRKYERFDSWDWQSEKDW